MIITSTLGKMALWHDYTIVCDDLKIVVVPVDNGTRVQRQVELLNPVEYTRDDVLKAFGKNAVVSKWEHTFTEDGKPAMAIVIKKN